MKNPRVHRLSHVILILFVLANSLLFPQENTLTPELILSIKPISDVQLSPDGTRILFHSSRPRGADKQPGGPWGEIWMLPAVAGEPVQFTVNDKTDRHARWSPDGKTIAFISTRGTSDRAQIYLISPDGGEAEQLTNTESSVKAFEWSPDGKVIAYTLEDPKTKEEIEKEKKGLDWVVADKEYKHTRLYGIRVATKENWTITQSDLTIWDFDWSPDSKRLIVQATETPKIDDQFMNSRLMIVDATGGVPKLLVQTEGKLEFPRWSPDGKTIAWLGATKWSDPYAGSVFVLPSTGGTPRNLTPNIEATATWLAWKPQSNEIVIRTIERQENALCTIDPRSGKISPLLTQPMIYTAASFSRDGRRIALVANRPYHPNEVYYGTPGVDTLVRRTTFNPQLEGVRLARQEIVKWKAYDGLDIEGVLVRPLDEAPGRRYPLFVQFHGGPEAADLNSWLGLVTRWGQMLAAQGIAVLYPNYRGSIGRGVAFSEANQKDMLGKEFEDALAGVDYLVGTGLVDPARVGLGGGSYGGYAGAWAATKFSHRFKLAIVWMGVSNRVSKVGTADNHVEEMAVHWTVDLYDNFELYWDRSPIKHIHNAQTPTLILHGERDTRVPISQAHELYTALRWKGVPVEFVTYPREGHGIVERAHQEDFLLRISRWAEKYLKGELSFQ